MLTLLASPLPAASFTPAPRMSLSSILFLFLTHLGVMLPCIYLPQSFSKDVPSVRLDSIVAKNLAASGIRTRVLGKS